MPTAAALLSAALSYARRGWRVIPLHTPTGDPDCPCTCKRRAEHQGGICTTPGKHPRLQGWPERATTDEGQIREWWTWWPQANVGIATGKGSGFWALDIDGEAGLEALWKLEEANSPLPPTPEQLTGGGGFHRLFRYAASVGNKVGFAPHLDTRSDGGLIVAEPSLHGSGREYAWNLDAHPDDLEIAAAPGWLLAAIRKGTAPKRAAVAEGEPIPEGQRNDTLFRDACAMRRRGFSAPAIRAALVATNAERCRPALSVEELEKIAAQAASYDPATAPFNGAAMPEEPPAVGAVGSLPKPINARALMAMTIAEPRWAVRDYICEGLTVLAGGQKMGKSWLVLALAIAVATGGIAWGSVEAEAGDVLYLALEDSFRRLQSRLAKILQGEPGPAALDIVIEWPALGEGGLLALEAWLDQHPRARLVIIDTLGKIRPPRARGGDLFAEDYQFMGELKTLAEAHKVAIVLVHHTSKRQSDDPFERVSGTTGLTAAADATLLLDRQRGSKDATLHVTGRDVEERSMALLWDDLTGTWQIVGGADDYHRSPERKAVLELLEAVGKPMGPKEIAAELGKHRVTTRVLLRRMVEKGDLVSLGGSYSPSESVTKQTESSL